MIQRSLTRPLRDAGTAFLAGPGIALRSRDFRNFLTGQGISLVGTWMQAIAEGWLVLELTNSPFAVGLTATFATLPILFFTLWGGVVADRVNRRRFLIFLQSVMLLEATALAVLTLTGQITVTWIWVLASIFGLATAFEVPTRQALLVELVSLDSLVSAAALNSTVYNLARVAGPAIAGIIVAAAGPGVAFAINALSYVGVLVGLYLITGRPAPAQQGKPSVWSGMRFIRSNPALTALTWQMVVTTVFALAFIPILPVYAADVLKSGPVSYGALTSAIGVGAATGAISMAAMGVRFRRARMAAGGAILLSLMVLALAVTWSLPVALVLLAIAGAAMAVTGIATATSLQLAAPNQLRGRVMAVYSFVVLGLAPPGAFLAGYIAEHLDTQWSIGMMGLVSLGGTLYLRRRLWTGEI